MEQWFTPSPSMQAALVEPRARVGVTGHFGNWEITGRYLAKTIGSLMSVAMPLKNPAVDVLLHRAREKNGQQIIERKGALRKLVRCLKAGGTVGLLLDQNTSPKEGGVFADFFGLPVSVSSAAGLLASITGAELIFAFTLPQADGTYRGEVPHVITAEEIAAMDQKRLTQKLTEQITGFYEEAIRKNPECWLWSYKRWRFIPEGVSPELFPDYSYSVSLLQPPSENEPEDRASNPTPSQAPSSQSVNPEP